MAFTEIKRPSQAKKQKPPAIGSITRTPPAFFVGLAKFGMLVLTAVIIYEMWKIITAAIQPAAFGNFSIEPFVIIFIATIGAITLSSVVSPKETTSEEQDMAKFENYKDAYEVEETDNDDDEEVDDGKYARTKSDKIYSFKPSTKFVLGLSMDKDNSNEGYWYFADGLKARTLSSVVNDTDDQTQVEIQVGDETTEPRLEKWVDSDTDNILYVFVVPKDFELQHWAE